MSARRIKDVHFTSTLSLNHLISPLNMRALKMSGTRRLHDTIGYYFRISQQAIIFTILQCNYLINKLEQVRILTVREKFVAENIETTCSRSKK